MGHTPLSELSKRTNKAKEKVEVGAVYCHWKDPDKLYVIESVGLLEETEEPCVIYKALYGEELIWIRTLEDFTSEVQAEEGEAQRFTKVKQKST